MNYALFSAFSPRWAMASVLCGAESVPLKYAIKVGRHFSRLCEFSVRIFAMHASGGCWTRRMTLTRPFRGFVLFQFGCAVRIVRVGDDLSRNQIWPKIIVLFLWIINGDVETMFLMSVRENIGFGNVCFVNVLNYMGTVDWKC